jgi:SAM-dependent methyltransferase
MVTPGSEIIAAISAPTCYLCGAVGNPLYQNLKDRLFGAPGTWNLKQCPDPDCGLVWLDPMPSEEAIGQAYVNYFTHETPDPQKAKPFPIRITRDAYRYIKGGYLARQFGYPTARSSWQRLLGSMFYFLPHLREIVGRQVMNLKAQPEGGRLLDVGCGSGGFLESMSLLGWDAVGVEVDPMAVKAAQDKKLRVHLGDLEAQNFPDNMFDVIVLQHVIEHLHDPIGLLKECRRLLKSGGRLILITPNVQSWGHRLFKDTWRGLEPPRHLYLFSSRTLPALAKASGFAILSLDTSAYTAPYIYFASSAIKKGSPGGSNAASVPERFLAWGFFWVEWALIKANPGLGDELILIGRR